MTLETQVWYRTWKYCPTWPQGTHGKWDRHMKHPNLTKTGRQCYIFVIIVLNSCFELNMNMGKLLLPWQHILKLNLPVMEMIKSRVFEKTKLLRTLHTAILMTSFADLPHPSVRRMFKSMAFQNSELGQLISNRVSKTVVGDKLIVSQETWVNMIGLNIQRLRQNCRTRPLRDPSLSNQCQIICSFSMITWIMVLIRLEASIRHDGINCLQNQKSHM